MRALSELAFAAALLGGLTGAVFLHPDRDGSWFVTDGTDPVLLAELILPDAMPPQAHPSELPRDLGFARQAWEKFQGYQKPSQPDRLVIRDFMPVPLADGSYVVPGLGVRLRETTEARTKLLEIVDVQEYGAFWNKRGNPAYEVGGLIGGTIFQLDQSLRSALSKSGEKKLRNGFSFQTATAMPYRNHKNEPRMQIQSRSLRVDPMVRPRGRWLVAEPEVKDDAPTPAEEYDQLIADFRAAVATAPCGMDGRSLLDLERQIDLLETASDEPLPFVNVRQERDTACAIATHGAYALADLRRLAILRQGDCSDVKDGVSDRIEQRAKELEREVAPPKFPVWARIGVFGLRDPSRKNLTPEEGRTRKACVLEYLEDDLFAGN